MRFLMFVAAPFAATYFGTAFVLVEPNPLSWPLEARAIAMAFALQLGGMIAIHWNRTSHYGDFLARKNGR